MNCNVHVFDYLIFNKLEFILETVMAGSISKSVRLLGWKGLPRTNIVTYLAHL
jgi:hypothetical protein